MAYYADVQLLRSVGGSHAETIARPTQTRRVLRGGTGKPAENESAGDLEATADIAGVRPCISSRGRATEDLPA